MAKKQTVPRSPAGLGAAGKAYWKSVQTGFEVEDHHVEILESACRQLDRAASARESIEKLGVTILDRFNVIKPNPCIEIERQAHSTFLKLSRELGLDAVVPESRGARRAGAR